MNENKLYKNFYIKGFLKLKSPLIIGSGEGEFTDTDIIRDFQGNPFIPGTSLAGSIRNYLEDNLPEYKKEIDLLFGKVIGKQEESSQSCIYIYDSFIDSKSKDVIRVRDGIKINRYLKTTKNNAKYDYETVQSGNKFNFKIKVVMREKFKDYEKVFNNILLYLIKSMEKGNLRLGAKTRRGFGRVNLIDVECYIIDFDNKENKYSKDALVNFKWDFKNDIFKEKGMEFLNKEISIKNIFINIKVPLKVKDTIMIRNYLLSTTDVDTCQIQQDNKFIIPGTSIAGAFRHRMFKILYEFGLDESESIEIVESIFGYVKENKKGKNVAKASDIYFEEMMDKKESKFLDITRTKIDRFTGGAYETGLFDSRVAIGGEIELSISLKKSEPWKIGLVLLVIYDLITGMLSVGGETSIGRGLLCLDDHFNLDKQKINIDGQPLNNDEKYMIALAEKLLS